MIIHASKSNEIDLFLVKRKVKRGKGGGEMKRVYYIYLFWHIFKRNPQRWKKNRQKGTKREVVKDKRKKS
jgi:hypothetical protein